MAAADIERPNYYPRQFLGAEDFIAEQSYQRNMRRRHNVGPHTWGIVVGLELVYHTPNAQGLSDVFVQPGLAVDGYGREIVVLAPSQLNPALFAGLSAASPIDVWIGFEDVLAQRPTAGYAQCDPLQQYARVHETFRIFPAPARPTHGPVIVAGNQVQPLPSPVPNPPPALFIPGDESVPYQELPDDADDPLWLVYLGKVNWDGTSGFVTGASGHPLPADSDIANRVYAAAIAADVLSPESTLRIRPRTNPTAVDATDFASVEGRLRVDGGLTARMDVFVPTGKLQFQDRSAVLNSEHLWLTRLPGADHLRIHLGDAGKGTTQLTVGHGPDTAASEPIALVVTGKNNVYVPSGKLSFSTTAYRQFINLWGSQDDSLTTDQDVRDYEYGIGAQTSALYMRSNFGFAWFNKGSHNDQKYDPGGGSLLMKLDPAGLAVQATAGTGGNLTVGGVRTYLQGVDGAGNHWVMGGGALEPDYNALAFCPTPIVGNDPTLKQVKIGPDWSLQLQGKRTYVMGLDGAGYHWVMGGDPLEPAGNAIGFEPASKSVLIGSAWRLEVEGDLKVDGTLSATTSQVGQDVHVGTISFIGGGVGTTNLTVVSNFPNPSSANLVVGLSSFESIIGSNKLSCSNPAGTRDANIPNQFVFDIDFALSQGATGLWIAVFEP